MITKNEILQYQKFAESISIKAGKILLNYKNKPKIKKHKKGFLDVVTDADYASESFLIEIIKKNFPHHNILSEETPIPKIKSQFEWIIDPLDGTRAYINNTPYYYVNIALECENRLIVGVVYQPETNRLYSAGKGIGFKLNNKFLTVSSETQLKNSTINIRLVNYCLPKNQFPSFLKILEHLIFKTYRVCGVCGEIESLFLVATGAREGFLLFTNKDWCPPKWWDIAPGILMVEEAGGKVTDFYGNSINNKNLTKGLVASNGKTHNQILKLVCK